MNKLSTTLMATMIAVQARVPVLLWGLSGIGKSAVTRKLAIALNYYCATVIASIREPADFAGLPVIRNGLSSRQVADVADTVLRELLATGAVDFEKLPKRYQDMVTSKVLEALRVHDERGVVMEAPKWAHDCARALERGHAGALLFLDELTTAPPAVQAALLRVVLERTVGDLELPDHVSIVSAANPPEHAAGGYELAPPLANRFCHLQWPVDEDEWIEGMVAGWPEYQVPALPKNWTTRLPVSRAATASFVRARRGSLHKQPKEASKAGTAWPSPRSWEMTAILEAAAGAIGHPVTSDVTASLVAGCLGDGMAVEYVTYRNKMDLADPEEALRDPKKVRLPGRGDQLAALLDSVAAAALSEHKEKAKRYTAAWILCARVAEDKPDLAVPASTVLAKNQGNMVVPKEATVLYPLLKKAGIIS